MDRKDTGSAKISVADTMVPEFNVCLFNTVIGRNLSAGRQGMTKHWIQQRINKLSGFNLLTSRSKPDRRAVARDDVMYVTSLFYVTIE